MNPTTPEPTPELPTQDGLQAVIEELNKQRNKWGDAHDDNHQDDSIPVAAREVIQSYLNGPGHFFPPPGADEWGLGAKYNKDPRKCLIVAAALLISEIRRFDRANRDSVAKPTPVQHNPDNLTDAQIGVSDGWRLLDEDEGTPWDGDTRFTQVDCWICDAWLSGAHFNCAPNTYRTRLSHAELQVDRDRERGLAPAPEASETPTPNNRYADTPRTAAAIQTGPFHHHTIEIDFARTLERELTASKAELAKLDAHASDLQSEKEAALSELAKVTEGYRTQVEKLRNERDEVTRELLMLLQAAAGKGGMYLGADLNQANIALATTRAEVERLKRIQDLSVSCLEDYAGEKDSGRMTHYLAKDVLQRIHALQPATAAEPAATTLETQTTKGGDESCDTNQPLTEPAHAETLSASTSVDSSPSANEVRPLVGAEPAATDSVAEAGTPEARVEAEEWDVRSAHVDAVEGMVISSELGYDLAGQLTKAKEESESLRAQLAEAQKERDALQLRVKDMEEELSAQITNRDGWRSDAAAANAARARAEAEAGVMRKAASMALTATQVYQRGNPDDVIWDKLENELIAALATDSGRALLADQERLDWMDAHDSPMMGSLKGESWIAKTFRAAIDAARQKP